ncbi:MAG: phosphate ABC transporter ATP-binding protein PstB [Candidatus Kapabacteria bacterium]|nr:phosphate ABC transporter ATP-binding protein PstB [Candidatus Kapabacteria bacterium]
MNQYPIMKIKNLSVEYAKGKPAVKNINAEIMNHTVTAIIGPSGCGKSTLLRAMNRIHELYDNINVTGEILLDEENIFRKSPIIVRRKIGMVFQRPNPFPNMSIYENVLSGYTLNGIKLKKSTKNEIVQTNLESVGLWDEVKESLQKKGTFLSGGQQQRLCIARALALRPQVLLMDEPTSALDPIATKKIEELILQLKNRVTIVVVTHNMQQATRLADSSMFMYLGELIEYLPTYELFNNPKNKKTQDYISGNFS